MDSRDLVVDTFDRLALGHPERFRVRVTHKPSGVSVEGSGANGAVLKKKLIRELEAKIESLAP